MEILTTGVAGTMESSDIIVRIENNPNGGIVLSLESTVMKQFGRRIEAVIRETLENIGIKNALVSAVDKGALDCTVEARVKTAAYRAANRADFTFSKGEAR
ncbi:MAG: citrate lyase acyl carrier protein [Clostridia bacterium]